jgi:hypothetical protein
MRSTVFLLALQIGGMIQPAIACEEPVAGNPAPMIVLRTAWPHMIVASINGSRLAEFDREPPIERQSRIPPSSMERHDALPATRYRYRARERTTNGCPLSPWSDWSSVETPAAPASAPGKPRMLDTREGDYVVTLNWTTDDDTMDGFVLLRCIDEEPCLVAAVVNPDERTFELHTLRAARYALVAFNAHGYSAMSNRTVRIGTDIEEAQTREHRPPRPSDSLAARATGADASSRNADVHCTTPEVLIAEGWTLIGVQGMDDLYLSPDSCGTGGCVYAKYTVDNGCYGNHRRFDVLASTPPFEGVDTDRTDGVVVANSSSNAANGTITIYRSGDAVDSYEWNAFTDPVPGSKPPFHAFGSLQYPERSPIVFDPEGSAAAPD